MLNDTPYNSLEDHFHTSISHVQMSDGIHTSHYEWTFRTGYLRSEVIAYTTSELSTKQIFMQSGLPIKTNMSGINNQYK